MLSRVAESLYWMSRYMERAASVGRCVDVNLHLLLDLPDLFEGQWDAVVKITGDSAAFNRRYGAADADAQSAVQFRAFDKLVDTMLGELDANAQNVIQFLAFDRANPNSIASCVAAARENARSVREIISSEAWEELNVFYLNVTSPDTRQRALSNPAEFFRGVRRAGHAIAGVMIETMSREEAWHFSRMGRLLERADQTTRILDLKYFLLLPGARTVGTAVDDIHWMAILRSAGAFEMYRKVYGRVAAARIVSFLVLDTQFPRSVRYCVNNAESSLRAITGTPHKSFRNPAERRLGRLASELDYTEAQEVVGSGLHQFLDEVQVKLNKTGDSIFQTFFAG